MQVVQKKSPGLLTAIGIGVGSMIGSGWLFSAYYAAQYMGPSSFFAWAMGAIISLMLAMLLAEIAGMFKHKALFSRLITISHDNADFGFVVAISAWLCLVLVIPTEASATIQYLSTAIPAFTEYLFIKQQHTVLGSTCIVLLVLIYTMLNFWGIRTFAKASNTIAILKILIPVLTALLLIIAAFHPSNFAVHGLTPHGSKSIFKGVVVCGIFYTFYGFSLVAMYGAELENPKKNIPRALIISVLICFIIYCLLQTAFIGSLPPNMVALGWSQLNFTSPFAQLLILINVHILSMWSIVLYIDAAVSPSGTAMICLSSASRTITGMAQDRQFPQFFDHIHPVYLISRPSLIFTTIMCCFILVFFKNWQALMILVSTFQLITCVAIPIAFTKLRKSKPELERIYRVRLGGILSYAVFLILSLFLIQINITSLVLALVLSVLFFLIYVFCYYRGKLQQTLRACYSSWSIFLYMAFAIVFKYVNQTAIMKNWFVFFLFILIMSFNFKWMVNQKNYNQN